MRLPVCRVGAPLAKDALDLGQVGEELTPFSNGILDVLAPGDDREVGQLEQDHISSVWSS